MHPRCSCDRLIVNEHCGAKRICSQARCRSVLTLDGSIIILCSHMASDSNQPSLPGELSQDELDVYTDQVPENLRRATSRLQFSPTYVVVGVYRLLTDKKLYVPAWEKCQHGLIRGATIAMLWVS